MTNEVLEKPVTALTVPERAAIALGADKARVELAALVLKSKDVQAINSPAGRDEAHSFAMALVKARTTIGKISKEARDEATKFRNAVIEEEAKLIAITEPEEKRLLALRDAWDEKVAAEKAAKAAAERARITAIHERIASIRNYHTLAMECRTSERVQALLDKMVATWLAFNHGDDFEEFGIEAQDAFDLTKQRMSALIEQKKADEAERARIKAEQEAEAAKLKEAREAQAAAAKALSDERAAFAAQQEAARLSLIEQARQIAADRLALENAQREAKDAADRAAYVAAITESPAPLPTPEVAQDVPEPVADLATAADLPTVETLVLTGRMFIPVSPSARELIKVVANHFDVSAATAAEWLTNAADEIANFE